MRSCGVAIILFLTVSAPLLHGTSWKGTVHDETGHAVREATITLQAVNG
jgi:hypothetical protein